MGCQSFGADGRVPYCRYERGKIYDGMDMAFMIGYDSDPRGADTGGDEFSDAQEVALGTDLKHPDSDGGC